MILRDHYIAPIRAFYDSDLIKVITGIRRCGKSVILADIHKEVKECSSNVVSLDFEDAAVLAAVWQASAHHRNARRRSWWWRQTASAYPRRWPDP